jgi:hypothetical protein
MPRGQYKRKTTLDLSPAIAEVTSLVPPDAFTTLAWWEKLNEDERKVVVDEGRQLAKAMLDHGRSRIAIGQHLSRLQGVLEPHNVFGRFLKNFHFSKRTAYRYIKGFQNAQQMLPESVLKVAMAKGVNIIGDTEFKPLGVYTDAVRKLPVPKDATEEQAATYIDQLENVRKQLKPTGAMFTMPEPQDPQTLLKECYRFVSLRYKRLPSNSKTRASWVRNLVGLILSDLGVSGQQTFAPQAVPEDFKALRGRPTTVAASA